MYSHMYSQYVVIHRNYVYFFFVGLHNFWLFNDVLRQMLPSQTSLLCSGNEMSGAYVKYS